MKAGWQQRAIGEVAEVIAGQSPEGSFYNSSGEGLPFYQGKKEFREKFIGTPTTWTSQITKVALEGDVLMSVRAPVGPVNFATQESCIGRGLAAIRSGGDLDRNFLFYFLLSKQEEISGTEGAVFASINKNDIQSIAIVVPPLIEQQSIVAILDEAFDGIAKARANAEQNLQNARALFESHLQAVFTQRGEGWVEKTLEDTVDKDCSLSYGIVQPGHEYQDGLLVVRPTDLGSKVIATHGLKRIDPSLANSYRRTTLRGGDLLLCVRGSTGIVSVASAELAGANVTRGIVPIVFDPTLVSQDFGYFLLRSEVVQSQIREKTYGAALMQINIRDMRVLILPLPPLEKQEDLATAFDELESETSRLESLYQRKLAALNELKKSLLHQAFSGML